MELIGQVTHAVSHANGHTHGQTELTNMWIPFFR